MVTWVILGCGYTGERVARLALARGDRVIATTRREERAAELRAIGCDVNADWGEDALVVDSIPDGSEIAWLAQRRARRIVYLSSTAVYGACGGAWVNEDTPVNPAGPRGAARLAAERALQAGVSPTVVIRIPAIYGPGRGVEARLRAGTYRVMGDGLVSRIHVDDLARAIVAAALVDPLPRDTYVVGDDRPETARAHADAIAARLGLPPPPSAPIPDELREMFTGDRRVDNRRMKEELGVVLAHPVP